MQKKLFLYFGIVFAIGMLISTLLSFSVIKKEADTTTREHMITEVKLIAEAVRYSGGITGGGVPNGLSAGIENATKSRITLISMDGVVLYDSEVDYKTMGNHGDRPEFLEAIKGGLGVSTRYSKTIGTDFLYVAKKTMTNDGREYVIRLSMPLQGIKDIITKTERELEWAFFIGLIISLLMGYSVAVFLSRPLRKITESAKEITEGNFGGRLYYKGHDEIRNLTSAFNEMTSKLGSTMTELKQKNANMESILDNVCLLYTSDAADE